VLRGPDSTGYYTPLPGGNYALTRPKTKTMTVALFDSARGTIVDVDSGVPALPAQRVPGRRALSYVRLDTLSARHEIREVDLATRHTTTLVKTVPGRMAHAWIPGHATILMAKGNVLYARRIRGANADTSWRAVATFADPELRSVTAYVVSPSGDRLILISPKRPSLAVLIRDSLEAGHSGAEVAAMVSAWRDAGRLSGYDVSEGGVSAIANEQMVRAHSADAIALRTLTLALFPSSHRAAARLGDALLATGDTTSASASYRKALANNPRSTDAERKAAADVEAKLKGLP
jgi:tetratricopeptide (TPR) repeat protein